MTRTTVRYGLVLAAAAALVPTLAPSAQSAAPAPPITETLFLDSFEAPSDGAAGPVRTVGVLNTDVFHVVTVDGTFTVFPASRPLNCGSPEALPRYPSPGTPARPVAVDAEVVFAEPCTPGRSVPRHTSVLRMDLGAGPVHVEPVGGRVSTARADHTYSYLVRGIGAPASFAFQLNDGVTTDNSGMLRIQVRQADRADCSRTGWRDFGVFRNHGDCVSYVATDGRNGPAGA